MTETMVKEKPRLLLTACTVALGVATAFASGESARACTIVSTNAQFGPVMPDYIHRTEIIALARVLNVRPDIGGAVDDGVYVGRPMGDTHVYRFETVEVLKGTLSDAFHLRGGAPFGEDTALVCSNTESEACRVRTANAFVRENQHALANGARQNWSRFYSLGPSSQSGMGLARHHPPLVDGGGDCRTFTASFEVGETFLIFGSQSSFDLGQQVHDPYGLNHQLITRSDDAWLDAVRHFTADPNSDKLPPQPFSTLMNALPPPFIIRPVECRVSEWSGFEATASEPVFTDQNGRVMPGNWRASMPSDEATRLARYCNGTQEFLAYPWSETSTEDLALPPFPIVDGKVDFSGMPGPWTFTEGEQIDLETVLEIADAVERNEE